MKLLIMYGFLTFKRRPYQRIDINTNQVGYGKVGRDCRILNQTSTILNFYSPTPF